MRYRSRHQYYSRALLLLLGLGGPLYLPNAASAMGCGPGVALQVLGSGGPVLNSSRASAGYILWVDEKARVLIDAGAGTYKLFGHSGARLEDLRLIALSHLHVDHAAELPAYIKGGYFTERERPLVIVGPAGSGDYPGVSEYMRRLFAPGQGAYAYLSGTLDGTEGQFKTPVQEITADSSTVASVLDEPDLKIKALPVGHGPVPTLAYRIEARGMTLVYGADQNGDTTGFIDFARNADLLVMPLAITEDAQGEVLDLHAKPSEIGTIAMRSGAKQLLLSHIMPAVEATLDDQQGHVKAAYKHPVDIAEDLACVQFTNPG